MFNMSDGSREFLERNCPEVLSAATIKDALLILYMDIDKKGFGGSRFDEYNDYGREAQKVYDDLYLSNPKK